MTNMNVPKLRFKGFSGEWIEERTDKLCDFKKGKGFSKNDLSDRGNPILLYGSLYTNFHSYLSTVETFVQDVNYDVCLSVKGDVVVHSSGETREDIARATNIDSNDIIIGGDLNILHPKEMLNSLFLSLYITYGKGHEKLRQLAQGNSVVHLYNSDLKSLKILHPKIEEQQKIGDFLKKIDKLIELQTKKLEALKKLKQGYLQKMFPQDGDKVPRLRFKGFSDEWKEERIDNLFDCFGGKSIEKYFNSTGDSKVISIGSYGLNSEYIDQGIRVDSNIVNKDMILDEGDLSMILNDKTSEGNIIGRVIISNGEKFVLNQRSERLVPKKDSPKFLFFLINHLRRNKILKIAQGGTQIYVNFSSVKKIELPIPIFQEQTEISMFLEKIDILINVQTTMLQKLIKLKEAYLQKMFM